VVTAGGATFKRTSLNRSNKVLNNELKKINRNLEAVFTTFVGGRSSSTTCVRSCSKLTKVVAREPTRFNAHKADETPARANECDSARARIRRGRQEITERATATVNCSEERFVSRDLDRLYRIK